MADRLSKALEDFDIAVREQEYSVDGASVWESYLDVYDPDTKLLIMSIPQHRKATREEVESAVDDFIQRRKAYAA